MAQRDIDIQNVAALLSVFGGYGLTPGLSSTNRNRSTLQLSIGSHVNFTYRSQQRVGIVKYSTARHAMIEFVDGGRIATRSIQLDNVTINGRNENDSGVRTNELADGQAKTSRKPEMFNKERHRFSPSTTSIASVLTGLSSKHNDTARQVIQEVVSQHGEDAYYKAVYVIVAD